MRLLLDTHALLWTLSASPKLSGPACAAIGDERNEKLVSAACAFEITTKHRLGKLPEFDWIADNFPAILDSFAYTPLPITLLHSARAGALVHPTGSLRSAADRAGSGRSPHIRIQRKAV